MKKQWFAWLMAAMMLTTTVYAQEGDLLELNPSQVTLGESETTVGESETTVGESETTVGESEATVGESSEQDDTATVHVRIPGKISGRIDPFNIAGRGQIDFEDIVIANDGSTPVSVFLSDMEFFSDTIDLSTDPITEATEGKQIYLWLENEAGERVASLPTQKSGEDVLLGRVEPQEKLVMRLNGMANQYFYKWTAEDHIQFLFNFRLEADEPPEIILPPEEVLPPPVEIIPPKEEVVPPTDEVVPPKEEVVPPTDEVVPPTDEVTPPTDEVVPPTDEVTPPTDEVTPPTDEVTPPLTVGASDNN